MKQQLTTASASPDNFSLALHLVLTVYFYKLGCTKVSTVSAVLNTCSLA